MVNADKSSETSISFFGLLQQLYTVQLHWTILTEYIKKFTVKVFPTTRWESRVEAVKAEGIDCCKEAGQRNGMQILVKNWKYPQKWPFVVSAIDPGESEIFRKETVTEFLQGF